MKKKYLKAVLKELNERTNGLRELLKCYDITHKRQGRDVVKTKLEKLKYFLPNLDVEQALEEHTSLMSAVGNNTAYGTILQKTRYMLQNEGYKALLPIFVLSLCLPLDNAACERGFSVMNDIKTAKRNKLEKPLFPLMLIGIYKDFNYDYADLGVRIAATWSYD